MSSCKCELPSLKHIIGALNKNSRANITQKSKQRKNESREKMKVENY